MSRLPLACTVRGCHHALDRRAGAFVCSRGHSYDIARSGYVNLLQPQDRRSPTAGDTKASVLARARLLDAGVGRTILEQVARRAAALAGESPLVVDLGSGTGHAVAALADLRPVSGIGVDISVEAADRAARRFPAHTWVVANADRRLPLLDASVDLVLSLHGRRNAADCARILTPAGLLIVVVPAPDDLIQLRALVQGRAVERVRADAVVAEHEPWFELVERFVARERGTLEQAALLDLLRSTYRGARTREARRIATLERMDITLASECCVLRRRG